MNEKLEALLEAHVAFELEQWRGEALAHQIAGETQSFWKAAQRLACNQIIGVTPAQAAARRLLLDLDLPEELAAGIAELARHLLRLPIHRQTTVAEVLDQEIFEAGVELTADLDGLRDKLIGAATENPVYTEFAAELLYHGIKDYLFSEQAWLNRLPGFGLLFAAGSDAMQRSLPELQAQIEKRVRAYIEANLRQTLRRSRASVTQTLTRERIRSMGDKTWSRLAARPLAIGEALRDDEITALAGYGHRLWRQLRETEYAAELVDAALAQFFATHGDKTLADLLTGAGITEAVLVTEANALLAPLVQAADQSGDLEAMIRRRLTPFYRSTNAADAMP